MKKGRVFLSLLLSVMLVFLAFSTAVYADEERETESETEHPASYYEEIQSNQIKGWPQGDPVSAKAAVLMDADTGAILYAKNMEEELPPASITKIMTTLLALENGNLDDVVTFSEYAVYSIEYGSSHLGLTEGEQLTLEQCLYGIMLASANEISNAVGEHIGGDIETFTDMMNERAEQIGCTHTHFMNAHGLTEENHYVCAKDMALIMREALKIPKFREIIGTVEYEYPKTNLVDEVRYFMNHHKMISEEGMLYDGCIGGKNGFTDEAGNTLVTAAERDGLTLIAVVLQVPGLYLSYEDTKTLLDYGFANFSRGQVTNTGSADMEITGVSDAQELEKIRQADILKRPFSMVGSTQVTLPKGVDASALKKKMDFSTNTLQYSYEGQVLGSVPFLFTGEWETEAPTEGSEAAAAAIDTAAGMAEGASAEAASGMTAGAATGTPAQEGETLLDSVKAFFRKAGDACIGLYDRMDAFIEENTIASAVVGAVLLLIFIPLLILIIVRHRKYQRILELREEDLKERQRLEEEIERKSTAQVEAELKARELELRLEEERRKNQAGAGGANADGAGSGYTGGAGGGYAGETESGYADGAGSGYTDEADGGYADEAGSGYADGTGSRRAGEVGSGYADGAVRAAHETVAEEERRPEFTAGGQAVYEALSADKPDAEPEDEYIEVPIES